jgi:hypothetical protein
MFDCETLAKARAAATRLDGQLRELQSQRQRLETEIACVRTIIDLCEPAQRLADPPAPAISDGGDSVTASVLLGAASRGAAPDSAKKPRGLPSIAQMITTALEDAAKQGHDGLRPCDMAEFVRTTWWRDVQTKVVNTTAWQMAKAGKLAKDGNCYRLNGHNPQSA